MTKKVLLLAVPAVSILALAIGTQGTSGSTKEARILCIGDSTLYARNALFMGKDGFPEQLARLSARPVINDGICGGTTHHVMLTFLARHTNEHFRAIVIRVGLNDIRNNVWSPDAYRKLLIEAKNRADRVVVVKWEDAHGEMGETNPIIARIAREEGCTYVVPELSLSDFLIEDPIHPTVAGSRKIADAVWRELVSSHA